MAKKSLIAKAKRKPKFRVRQYNRCRLCGRPRAYLRKFGMCRLCFRRLANEGKIPGGLKRPAGRRGQKERRLFPMMTDPIADMLTRIRNANMVRHESVDIPASNMKRAIAEIMKQEGFIKDYEYIPDNKQGVIRIWLKYGANRERVITGLKRISKPGLRVYVKKDELPKVLGGWAWPSSPPPRG